MTRHGHSQLTFTSRNPLIALVLRCCALIMSFAHTTIRCRAEDPASGHGGTRGEKSVDRPALLTPLSTSAEKNGGLKNCGAGNILGFRQRQHAIDVLLDQRLFVLSPEQHTAFMHVLDNPPLPNAALKKLGAAERRFIMTDGW